VPADVGWSLIIKSNVEGISTLNLEGNDSQDFPLFPQVFGTYVDYSECSEKLPIEFMIDELDQNTTKHPYGTKSMILVNIYN
jgi:hypothetical protein